MTDELADRAAVASHPLADHNHRHTAEQQLLGRMLLSKDAIADVVETVQPDDLQSAHASIFSAILDLYHRNEPADPITVAYHLSITGEDGKAARAYLHELVCAVPAYSAEPAVHELTADVGLTGEQQIRAIALEIAYRHLPHDVYEVADEAAAYIRDGSRP